MLEFKNVSYTYPFQEKPAVKNISFSIAPGELLVCTGASGCGKSTLIRLANGLCPQYFQGYLQGHIEVLGQDTQGRGIAELSSVVGTLFQDPEQQFFALNVEDELVFSLEWKGISREDMQASVTRAVAEFGLEQLLDASIHALSEGQKQKVGLASLSAQHTKVLILDEPSANLDPEATEALAVKLQELKAQGLTILVVDHRLYWLRNIADKVLVMQDGAVQESGDFSLLDDAELRARYGLRSTTVQDERLRLPVYLSSEEPTPENSTSDFSQSESPTSNTQGPALSFSDLHFAYKGKEPLFSAARAHIAYGITILMGDNGTGKTTLARIIAGLQSHEQGQFLLHGKPCDRKERIRQTGIVLQNADHQLHMRTALEEVCTSLEIMNLPKAEIQARAQGFLQDFGLAHLADRHPQSLSGGEKQRLVIACALAKNPQILLLDEPTSGLDGTNMQRLITVLQRCQKQGICILLITHDLELLHHVGTYALRLPLAQHS